MKRKVNSLTSKSVPAGTKNDRFVEFLHRNVISRHTNAVRDHSRPSVCDNPLRVRVQTGHHHVDQGIKGKLAFSGGCAFGFMLILAS